MRCGLVSIGAQRGMGVYRGAWVSIGVSGWLCIGAHCCLGGCKCL